jgi:hypothetical protein
MKSSTNNYLDDIVLLFFNQQGMRIAIADLRPPGRSYSIHPNCSLLLKANVRIPFVEGTYYAGIYFQCADCQADFLDLAQLQILGTPFRPGLNVYDARWRGIIELEYSVTSILNEYDSTVPNVSSIRE